MTPLILVRHGQTDWNLAGRYQGQTDLPLNETGRSQAESLASQLANQPFEAIYSSDLQRAHETASIVARKLHLPVLVEPRLREVNLGRWEGKLVGDIIDCYPAEWEMRRRDPVHARPPGGEAVDELASRIWGAVGDIVRSYPSGPTLIVSHGLALAAVLCRAHDIPLARIFDVAVVNAHPVEVIWPDLMTSL